MRFELPGTTPFEWIEPHLVREPDLDTPAADLLEDSLIMLQRYYGRYGFDADLAAQLAYSILIRLDRRSLIADMDEVLQQARRRQEESSINQHTQDTHERDGVGRWGHATPAVRQTH